MPVPVATSSTRSSGCAATYPTRARRHRGSWPRDRRVATRSYDTAMPANRPRAWRERAETTVSPDGVALVIDIASAGAAILTANLSDLAGRSNAVRGVLLEDRGQHPQRTATPVASPGGRVARTKMRWRRAPVKGTEG